MDQFAPQAVPPCGHLAPLLLQSGEVDPLQLGYRLFALVQTGRNCIPGSVQPPTLGLKLLLVVLQTQPAHGLHQRREARLLFHDLPVGGHATHLKQGLPPFPPVQPLTEPAHAGQHPPSVLTGQLVHFRLKGVLLDRDIIHIVLAGVPVIGGVRVSTLHTPLLVVGLAQGHWLPVRPQRRRDLRHRPMVRHLSGGVQRLDLKAAVPTAVLPKQQPGQRVVYRGLARGVVPINAGAAPIQRQR